MSLLHRYHNETFSARLRREARLARREIRKGRFERTMAVITAFAAIVSGWEAYAQHLRGAFSHWLMWTPVGLTPPTIVAALGALASPRVARRVLPALALASLADGLVGLRVPPARYRPDGWRLAARPIQRGHGAADLCTPADVYGRHRWAASLFLASRAPARAAMARGPLGRACAGACCTNVDSSTARPAERSERVFAANVRHGRFQRTLALTSAVFAILAGGEAYFEHLRGSFNSG